MQSHSTSPSCRGTETPVLPAALPPHTVDSHDLGSVFQGAVRSGMLLYRLPMVQNRRPSRDPAARHACHTLVARGGKASVPATKHPGEPGEWREGPAHGLQKGCAPLLGHPESAWLTGIKAPARCREASHIPGVSTLSAASTAAFHKFCNFRSGKRAFSAKYSGHITSHLKCCKEGSHLADVSTTRPNTQAAANQEARLLRLPVRPAEFGGPARSRHQKN